MRFCAPGSPGPSHGAIAVRCEGGYSSKAARELRGRLAMTAFSEGVLSGVCIDAPLSEHARRGE